MGALYGTVSVNSLIPANGIPFGRVISCDTIMKNLALAVRDDEEGAVETLIRTYQDQIFSYALRLLRNRFDAQEVAQDTFLRGHCALTRLYSEEKCRRLALRPWLFRITHNLVRNRLRSRRGLGQEGLSEAFPPDGPMSCHGRNAVQDLISAEERERLERAIGRLNQDYRDVILLRFMEELPYLEIAAVTGVSEAAVRAKVFRALRRLRKLLDESGGEYAL